MQLLAPLLVASAAPVIDFDGTAYLQLGLFLLLMLILHPLLFKPWLETRERRETSIAGAVAEAARLRKDADETGATYDQRLKAAREEAQGIRSASRKSVEATRVRLITETRARSGRSLEEARLRASKEAAAARESLQGEIDSIARALASKILGRAI